MKHLGTVVVVLGVAACFSTAPMPSPSPTPSLSPSPTANIAFAFNGAVHDHLGKTGAPGAAAAVYLADGRHWSAARGVSNIETGERLRDTSMFPLGRAAWLYLHALTLLLAERGEIGLDEPVLSYLPDLDVNGLTDEVSVRHLMSESSGLASFHENPAFGIALESTHMRPGDALAFVGAPRFKAGTRAQYSFTNSYLLVMVVEAVTGRRVTESIQEEILDPYDLNDTALIRDLQDDLNLVTGYVTSYGPTQPMTFADYRKSVAGEATDLGTFASSIDDFTGFGHELMAGDVLREETREQLHGPVARGHFFPWGMVDTGLGVYRTDYFKAGSALGFGQFAEGGVVNLFHFPEHGFTIGVIANEVSEPVPVTPEAVVAALALEAAKIK